MTGKRYEIHKKHFFTPMESSEFAKLGKLRVRITKNMVVFTKSFSELSKNDTGIAGGKGASLGEMTNAGIQVPPGFVVLANAFDKFLEETDLDVEIEALFHKVNHKDINSVERTSVQIRNLIGNAEFPKDIAFEILSHFSKLKATYVAVRSSATAEDSSIASWAGELESYLNTTKDLLFENVKKCWSSLFTPRSIFYRFEKNLHNAKVSVAVVVQTMIQSEIAGVCFTVHPVTKDHDQMVIEAGYGLGEAIVGGKITPDTYVLHKGDWKILDKNISQQTMMITKYKDGNIEKQVPKSKQEKQKLRDPQILELAQLCQKIEEHYNFPQDIEWALENNKFFITQSRPITTLPANTSKTSNEYDLTFSRECIVPTLQAWFVSENDKLSKYIDYRFPTSGWMFFEYINGLARNYIDMDAIKSAYNFALAKTLKDKKYFDDIEKSFWHYLDLIKPYLEGKKYIHTKKELKTFFGNVTEVWGAQTICYAFTFFENPDMPKDIFQRSEKVRLAIETIVDDCNRIFTKGLQNIFGQKYVYDYKYLTVEEIVSETIPDKNVLQHRSKYIIYFKGIRYDDSLDSFLIKKNKYLKKIKYGKTDGLKGQIAYQGRVSGTAKICYTSKEMNKIREGDVLVSSMTTPNFLPAIKLASAIVTDEGGVTCHAAIVARELKKPCVIGTKIATKILKNGDLVEVDADNGIVKIIDSTICS